MAKKKRELKIGIKECAVIFLISAALILGSLYVLQNNVLKVKENKVPEWIPAQYDKDRISWGGSFNSKFDLFIVPEDSEWEGNVEVQKIQALNALWKANSFKIDIIEPESMSVETKCKMTETTWKPNEKFVREFGIANVDAIIPFKSEWLHKIVTAKVNMEVFYPKYIPPANNDSGNANNNGLPNEVDLKKEMNPIRIAEFVETTESLERTIDFYVVTKDEMTTVKKNIAESENHNQSKLFYFFILIIIVGSCLLIYAIKSFLLIIFLRIKKKIKSLQL